MASAVGLRGDFDGTGVVRLARLSGHANQVRRLLALAVIYDGGARHEAARVGGVGLQTVRDWVLRFNAQGPDGLLDGKAPGPRPVLGPEHKRALAEVIEQGPIPTCQTASKRGSDSLSVQRPSSCGHQPGFEEIEVGAVVHLAFDELQAGDLAFDLTA